MKRIGIIGLGKQTQDELIPAILSCDIESNIEAICDIDENVLKKFNQKFPNAHPYSSYEELFDREKNLDCVIICVPHKFYFPIAKVALRRKVAVFKEKPLAKNLLEAQTMCNLASESKTPLFTLTKRAYYPAYQLGKLTLSQLGQVYQYSAKHFNPNGSIFEGWRSRKNIAGGGALLDLGYHMLDLIISYFGPPMDVDVKKSNSGRLGFNYKVEDSASLLLSHQSGVHGVFQIGCLSGPKEESLEIRGSNGTMMIKKDHVSLFNSKGIRVINKHFKSDSIFSVAKAFNAFFSLSYKRLKEYQDHQLLIMRTIDHAYNSIQENPDATSGMN